MVGFTEVLQHTPLAVMVPPPSLAMVPPLTADVDVMEVASAVELIFGAVTVGLGSGGFSLSRLLQLLMPSKEQIPPAIKNVFIMAGK